jgi:DNA-directed RNA polymerase subunit RPC12/RpoP
MALMASVRRFGCSRCGDKLIAPEMSEFISEEEVRHHWSCARCGHEFETTVLLSYRAVDPKIIEQFLPSLLVA